MKPYFFAIGCLVCTFIGEQAHSADTPTAANPSVRVTTNRGEFEIRLFQDKAPLSVANFLSLVEQEFYNGLIFHRVIANFVVQAGGYDASMNYRKPPATVANESNNGLTNRKGLVAMARLNDPNSADAQFYINVKTNPHLDATPGRPGYTVFGEVSQGWDVVESIELSDTHLKNGMPGVPEAPIIIERIVIADD